MFRLPLQILLGKPLFPGRDAVMQLTLITDLLGKPPQVGVVQQQLLETAVNRSIWGAPIGQQIGGHAGMFLPQQHFCPPGPALQHQLYQLSQAFTTRTSSLERCAWGGPACASFLHTSPHACNQRHFAPLSSACAQSVVDRISNQKARAFLQSLPPKPPRAFESKFPNADLAALDLLRRLLAFDPVERPTASEALQHPYFNGLPSAGVAQDVPLTAQHFDFELHKLSEAEVRGLIYAEVRRVGWSSEVDGGSTNAKRLVCAHVQGVEGGAGLVTQACMHG